eukprot:gnl/TRDRNA2_/TRDRNA2_36003_c0_seq1.p1 gnl/TRDRNA2_/TRDRNA2_36003_c0~~gnl/TRDRNA2_/TRDRNA2_36003_c0_seq1.p1  ORF type:complete len:478 (+),score=60.76 gnl/TRDRNA2_/TRDRNA2_36003_c0_seq1:82-1515(+)
MALRPLFDPPVQPGHVPVHALDPLWRDELRNWYDDEEGGAGEPPASSAIMLQPGCFVGEIDEPTAPLEHGDGGTGGMSFVICTPGGGSPCSSAGSAYGIEDGLPRLDLQSKHSFFGGGGHDVRLVRGSRESREQERDLVATVRSMAEALLEAQLSIRAQDEFRKKYEAASLSLLGHATRSANTIVALQAESLLCRSFYAWASLGRQRAADRAQSSAAGAAAAAAEGLEIACESLARERAQLDALAERAAGAVAATRKRGAAWMLPKMLVSAWAIVVKRKSARRSLNCSGADRSCDSTAAIRTPQRSRAPSRLMVLKARIHDVQHGLWGEARIAILRSAFDSWNCHCFLPDALAKPSPEATTTKVSRSPLCKLLLGMREQVQQTVVVAVLTEWRSRCSCRRGARAARKRVAGLAAIGMCRLRGTVRRLLDLRMLQVLCNAWHKSAVEAHLSAHLEHLDQLQQLHEQAMARREQPHWMV